MQHDDAAQIKVYLYTSLPRAIFTCKQKHHQLAKNNENHNITVRCTITLGIFATLWCCKNKSMYLSTFYIARLSFASRSNIYTCENSENRNITLCFTKILYFCAALWSCKKKIYLYSQLKPLFSRRSAGYSNVKLYFTIKVDVHRKIIHFFHLIPHQTPKLPAFFRHDVHVLNPFTKTNTSNRLLTRRNG